MEYIAKIRFVPAGHLPLEVFWACPTGRDTRVDPEHPGYIIYLIWLGIASGSPPEGAGKCYWGEGLDYHHDSAPDKQQKMDGWNRWIQVYL